MTVKELIAELQSKDPDARVHFWGRGKVAARRVEQVDQVTVTGKRGDEPGILLG
ncbi:MAG TPA: hypothetical protein VJ783_23790 [Pirellulales bacterium]|nr:hypothetical protein [Pirellulales bacterium]